MQTIRDLSIQMILGNMIMAGKVKTPVPPSSFSRLQEYDDAQLALLFINSKIWLKDYLEKCWDLN